ncbi:hypothetical protein MRX96_043120 [Rhipicephalus microplus]
MADANDSSTVLEHGRSISPFDRRRKSTSRGKSFLEDSSALKSELTIKGEVVLRRDVDHYVQSKPCMAHSCFGEVYRNPRENWLSPNIQEWIPPKQRLRTSSLQIGGESAITALYVYSRSGLTWNTRPIRLSGASPGWSPKTYYLDTAVPQGSILGPTLFNLAMSGVAENPERDTTARFAIYAVDITIWTEAVDYSDKESMQTELQAALLSLESTLKE